MPISMENAYALIIGIANYAHVNKLTSAVLNDARDIFALLVDKKYCGYKKENVQMLLDEDANQLNIRDAFANLISRCNTDSVVFIYVSSHGGRIESGLYAGEYLLPVDVNYESEHTLAETSISGSELTDAFRKMCARKMVVIFDCCHSGGIGEPKLVSVSRIKAGLSDDLYNQMKTGRGKVILASSRNQEVSWILPGARNSLFTQHVIKGLKGGVPGPGGVIRIFDLFDYVQPKVTNDKPEQHPVFKAELEENFAIALYQGGKSVSPPSINVISDHFQYDIFISYRSQEPDKTWVRKVLVPRLEALGTKVFIDYRDFRLGAPLVTEMARAVDESRYTLAILSPAYLTSNYTELENILAEHLGLEKGERRMLAIMKENCTPRLGMRARLWLDMTNDVEFEENLERLIFEIYAPVNS